MKNHLFIGLGGQGGKSIAELRKVFDQREADAKSLSEGNIKWDFLYIDSSRDVTNHRENWTHFGKNLKLNPDSFLYLKDGGNEMNPEGLALRPDISPWIGSVSVLKSFLEDSKSIQGANQRRRFGRLLFASKAPLVSKAIFEDKIDPMLANRNQCAIHIFASLAGGTGSGSLVDLVTMLRKNYPPASVDDGFPIFLYLYVTSNDFEDSQVGYFHQNQYATLRDLNALACGRYKPHLVGSDGGREFSGDTPITQIVLSTNLNDRNQNVDLQKQHKIIAEAAFERIFSYLSGNLNEAQQKFLTGEDRLASFPGEPFRNLMRSFRFGSLGMKRWEVPEEEVTELLASELYASCFKGILYRNWDSRSGFIAEKLQQDKSGVNNLLTSLAEKLESQFIENSRLPELFDAMAGDFLKAHEGIRNTGFKDTDLEAYEMRLKERYNGALMGIGVSKVFKTMVERRQDRLRVLMETIKSSIVGAWTKADRPLGLSYVSDVLSNLQELVRKKLTASGEPSEESSDQALRARIEARKSEWNKMTLLSVRFRRESLASAQRTDLMSIFRSDLRHRAILEDRDFMNLLITELASLASSYEQASAKLKDWEKKLSERRDTLRQDIISQSKESSNRYEISDTELEGYIQAQRRDAAALNNAADALLKKTMKNKVDQRGIEAIGRMSPKDELEYWQEADEEIYDAAKRLHDSITVRDGISPVLSGDLMEKLQTRSLENPEAFQNELSEFIRSSTCLAKIDTTQLQPKDMRGDQNMPRMPRKSLIVGLPRRHPFSEQLKAMITPLMPAGDNTAQAFYEHDDPSQIRLLSVISFMAARFTRVVAELEGKYTEALGNDTGTGTAYFTNIDPSGEDNQRPDLLLPSPEGMRIAMRSALWLGERIKLSDDVGCLIQSSNGRVVLLREGKEGILPDPIGESMTKARDEADIRTIYKVVEEVSSALAAQPAEVIKTLKYEVDIKEKEIRNSLGAASPDYALWVNERTKINEMLNR
jgi:hypothetical protein